MCAEITPVIIDGGILEGGGQILRMSIAFSALLKKPIRVTNIRGGRSQPGLRPQHLTGLRLVRDICNGTLIGDSIGSTEITFHPGKLSQGSFSADTKTAGSVCLLLQVALPCMLYGIGPCKVNLKGGTNAEMAPQIDYTLMVFKPIAEKFGCQFNPKIIRRGYYPKGGGEVDIVTVPLYQLKAVELMDFGEITKIQGRAFVAGVLPVKIAQQMVASATSRIRKIYKNVELQISAEKEPEREAFGNGCGIILVAETSTGCRLGGSALGKKGVPSEQIGEMAATELINNLKIKSCVDSYAQDQIIILMALAKGTSRIKTGEITLHTQTAIHVAHLLTEAKFKTISVEDHCVIECEGIGLIGNFDPQIHMNKLECCIPPN